MHVVGRPILKRLLKVLKDDLVRRALLPRLWYKRQRILHNIFSRNEHILQCGSLLLLPFMLYEKRQKQKGITAIMMAHYNCVSVPVSTPSCFLFVFCVLARDKKKRSKCQKRQTIVVNQNEVSIMARFRRLYNLSKSELMSLPCLLRTQLLAILCDHTGGKITKYWSKLCDTNINHLNDFKDNRSTGEIESKTERPITSLFQ